MAVKGQAKKPKEERREIIKEALKIRAEPLKRGEETKAFERLAEEHGISRQQIYHYLRYATDKPEERLEEAYEEVDFRLEVLRLLGYEIEESRSSRRA